MLKDTTPYDNYQQDTENLLIQRFVKFYNTLTRTQRRVFWYLHRNILKHTKSYPRQATIAKDEKCSRQFVNETIRLLVKNEFIFSIRQCRSSVYTLPKSLHNPNLSFIIKASNNNLKATSQATSLSSTQTNRDKAYKPIFDPLVPVLPCNTIRNTNAKSYPSKIKPILEGLEIPIEDKKAFSRYKDEHIEQALDQLNSFVYTYGKMPDSLVRFLQSKLNLAKEGRLKFGKDVSTYHSPMIDFGLSICDAMSFDKYTDQQISYAVEKTKWYEKKGRGVNNYPAFMHGILSRKYGSSHF